MPTGEMFYAEQISHRPGITAWLLEDPDKDYAFYGSYSLNGYLSGMQSFAGYKTGVLTLKLKDGTEYKFTKHPVLHVTGLIKGPQISTYCEHAEILDVTNGITADLHYNPWKDNSYKGMMKSSIKWAFGSKKKKIENEVAKRGDDVHIQIFKSMTPEDIKNKKERDILSQG